MMQRKELELVVDEPTTGHFYWTIISPGRLGELPRVVDYARGPLPTHSSALRIGASALRLQQTVDADAGAKTVRMLSEMRVEWAVETMPAPLMV
jgi:hypothetical protein